MSAEDARPAAPAARAVAAVDSSDAQRPAGLTQLVRRTILEMAEYAPPEDLERLARQLGVSVERIVKLDANENLYGCSPKVAQALARYRGYHLYPDPAQEDIRPLVARYVGAEPDQILLGNGSDELIDMLMRLVLDPGDEVLDFTPTFGMYAFNAQHFAARVVEVPRDERFDIDPDLALRACGPRTKLAIVATPNNPTGNAVAQPVVERLLASGRLVVVDEAYAEFSGASLVPLVQRYDNLVVLRTFSKWAGLAGLRIGYGVLPAAIAPHLWKLKPPFNVNLAAIVAVKATLDDLGYLRANVARIVEERERLAGLLASVPFLRTYPTQANFVLCRVVGREAVRVKEDLAQRGVLIRHYTHPRLRDCVRISVGRPRDTDRLIEALHDLAASA